MKLGLITDIHEQVEFLQTLYGHYEKTFKLWQDAGVSVPPCFIIAISKLVYDYISGLRYRTTSAVRRLHAGQGLLTDHQRGASIGIPR